MFAADFFLYTRSVFSFNQFCFLVYFYQSHLCLMKIALNSKIKRTLQRTRRIKAKSFLLPFEFMAIYSRFDAQLLYSMENCHHHTTMVNYEHQINVMNHKNDGFSLRFLDFSLCLWFRLCRCFGTRCCEGSNSEHT